MENPFIYDKFVTGKNFIGRKNECEEVIKILKEGGNLSIYEPAKNGKKSLIHQSLTKLKEEGVTFMFASISLFNTRDFHSCIKKIREELIRQTSLSQEEYESIAGVYPAFTSGDILSSRISIRETVQDIETIFELPFKISEKKNTKLIVLIDEFQNLNMLENSHQILKTTEKLLERYHDHNGCSYIFCGSMVNAMKEIFEHRKLFFKTTKHVKIPQPTEAEITNYINKGFLDNGKVIEKEQISDICKTLKNNINYINHFVSLCDSMSKGYIMNSVIRKSLYYLISTHEPRFIAATNSLTGMQIKLLEAVSDGETQLSTSKVIEKYGLNSSANIKRVKEALVKKEIITFEKEKPVILDPLFEYWLKTTFFNKK